jgi:Tol biopolymer transport system component
MALAPGTRIGVFEVTGSLGAGGMGEVYRATDTKLHRDVALKILPEAYASDSDRLARFKREAQVLASLNHPNIGAIHGLEESNGRQTLVLELVGGPTLAERIERGPIPIDEAITVARQIADALEAAHEKGIIHRDLKPSNIKVRPDGTVKVLDFGLAKALESPDSPTLAPASTEIGIILGTAAYMSPEQAGGQKVDKRTDIWAFGCVLYELLTGRRAFAGATRSDTIAAILEREPDWKALPLATPASIRRLIERCLTKDPRRRLRDIGDTLYDLTNSRPSEGTADAAKPDRHARIAAIVLLLAFVLALIATISYFRSVTPSTRDVRLEIPVPSSRTGLAPAISPDGRRVVYVAPAGTVGSALWVRSLNAVDATMLPGTEGAVFPFWSPDSQWIGFFAPGKLKKVPVTGGPPQTVTDIAGVVRGGTWSRNGVIVFANTVLRQITASGGEVSNVSALDASLDEDFHMWPFFLPDGRHFLYLGWSETPENRAVYIGSLDSKTRTRLLSGNSMAVYAPPGFVLFASEGSLVARPFDADRLAFTGDAVPIVEHFQIGQIGRSPFHASDDGTLIYRSGGAATANRQLLRVDRTGKTSERVGAPFGALALRLSPDGKRVAFSENLGSAAEDLWIYDTVRNIRTRLTTDPSIDHWPVWSPDGSRLVFDSSRRRTTYQAHVLYETQANGAVPERLFFEPEPGIGGGALDWSRDGRLIVFSLSQSQNVSRNPNVGNTPNLDLWVLPLSGDTKPFPYLTTPFSESEASLSPDGRWIAYTSNESGMNEVIVRSFPDPSQDRRQISTHGGVHPRWSGDGKEVYYFDPAGRIVAVSITANGKLEIVNSTPLIETSLPFPALVGGPAYPYDVTPDGQQFLISVLAENSSSLIVVLNWQEGLKQRVPPR